MHTIAGAGRGGGEGGLDIANTFVKSWRGRAEPGLRDDVIEEIAKIHREGRGARATVPAGYVGRAHGRTDHRDLARLRDTLESHRKVTITDEAIVAKVELDRGITGRFMPDKAIDPGSTSKGGGDLGHCAARGRAGTRS